MNNSAGFVAPASTGATRGQLRFQSTFRRRIASRACHDRLISRLWLPSIQFVLKPAKRGCMIARLDRFHAPLLPGSTAPTSCPFACSSSGALRQSRRFFSMVSGGCAVNIAAMDNRSDFADADLHILTFEIPDDALERAAGAPTLTMVNCTNPMLFQCPMMGDGQSGS